jgi:hypothetical protein
MEQVQAAALKAASSNRKTTTKKDQGVRQVQATTQSSRNYFPRPGHECASVADGFHTNRHQKHIHTRLCVPESLAHFWTNTIPNLFSSAYYRNTAHA